MRPRPGERPVERCLHGCWWTDAGELALYAGQTTGITALDDRWRFAGGPGARWRAVLPAGAQPVRARTDRRRRRSSSAARRWTATYLADLWLLADDSGDATPIVPVGDGARAGGAQARS